MSYEFEPEFFTIPDPEPGTAHPGDIKRGVYTLAELVRLLRDHADDPATIRFIANMLDP
jgi:hypothetical protein